MRPPLFCRLMGRSAIVTFLLLLFTACGGSSGGGGVVGAGVGAPAGTTGTTTIRIDQRIQAQAVPVPASITQVRITGSTSGVVNGVLTVDGGGRPYGPQTLPIAPVYNLENVPVAVDFLSLEYLDQNGNIKGLYYQRVLLVADQTFEINDPAIAYRPDDITSFQVLASGFGSSRIPAGQAVDVPNQVPASVRLYPRLPDGSDSDLLQRFTIYRSDNPSVVAVANGGVDFNSSDTSGSLTGVSPGAMKVRAVFFDLEQVVDVDVYDLQATGFGTLIISEEGSGSSSDPSHYVAYFTRRDVVAGTDAPAVDVTDQVEWFSSSADILNFQTNPGREGYFTLSGQPGVVSVSAYLPQYRVWATNPSTIEVDQLP